jgi:hypothetical protein
MRGSTAAGPCVARSDLFDSELAAWHQAALLIGLALFVSIYVSLLLPSQRLVRTGANAPLVALALLPLIAIALLLGGAPASFAALFVYVVAAVGLRLPPWAAVPVVLLTAAGVGVAGWWLCLGHSLSVIALKSELARKLVESDPERAASELRARAR